MSPSSIALYLVNEISYKAPSLDETLIPVTLTSLLEINQAKQIQTNNIAVRTSESIDEIK